MPPDELLLGEARTSREDLEVGRRLAAVGDGNADEPGRPAFLVGGSAGAAHGVGDALPGEPPRVERHEERPGGGNGVAETVRRRGREAARQSDRRAVRLFLGRAGELDEQRAVADVAESRRRRQERRLQRR
jgi:hypothetical protein